MSTAYRWAYCQARLQARFAQLPVDDDWQRLNGARGLSAFLEEARLGLLRPWVRGFSGQSDGHAIERGLRSVYRETVQQLAEWVPDGWRPALDWANWLPDLALIDHLARACALPSWASADPHWRTLLDSQGAIDQRALTDAGAGGLFGGGTVPLQAWLTEWRRRWPRCSRQARHNLDSLMGLIGGHHDRLAAAEPEEVWLLRQTLRSRLCLLFHQRLLQPAGPCIYLGLVALDLERLRAALVDRALFVLEEGA